MNPATSTQSAEIAHRKPVSREHGAACAAPAPCNLVLLGPPGAGKGTLAELLGSRIGIPHISSGDMFRAAIEAGTELGKQVAATINRGALVADHVTVALIRERLAADDVRRGYLLDGFPRTIAQAEALQELEELRAVVNLDVPDDLAVLRISGRRVCVNDGEIFHLDHHPPRVPGVCDRCGSALIQRDDDRTGAIRHRLEVYQRQTSPLVEFYRDRGLLLSVDGSQLPEQVRDQILGTLAPLGLEAAP